MGQFIDLTAADGQKIPAYVAKPEGQPKGAVVVVQEIFGVNAHIREVADGYAKDGYVAVAPSTFHRVKPNVELGYTDADMQEGFGYKNAVEALPAPGVMQDIQAAIDYAAQKSGGKVGIVGYCWGGLPTGRSASPRHARSAVRPSSSRRCRPCRRCPWPRSRRRPAGPASRPARAARPPRSCSQSLPACRRRCSPVPHSA